MSAFTVGSIIGKMKLNIGEWRRSVAGVQRDSTRIRRSLKMIGVSALAASRTFAMIGAASVVAGIKIAKSFMHASRTMENFTLTLEIILGDLDEANTLVEDMTKIARVVPFEFEGVLKSATQLSGALGGSADEIRAWMPLLLDLAGVIKPLNITLEETTVQFLRMFSSGAAAADLFREKSVLAFLGFNPGEIVSANETRKRIFEEWNKDNSKFRGAAMRLAETWDGQMSIMKDAWFLFRKEVMKTGLFQSMKDGLRQIVKALTENRTEIDNWVSNNAKLFSNIAVASAAFIGLTTVLGVLGLAWSAVVAVWAPAAGAFMLLIAPIGLVSVALIGLVAVFYWYLAGLRNWISENQQLWDLFVRDIVTSLTTVKDFVVWVFADMLEASVTALAWIGRETAASLKFYTTLAGGLRDATLGTKSFSKLYRKALSDSMVVSEDLLKKDLVGKYVAQMKAGAKEIPGLAKDLFSGEAKVIGEDWAVVKDQAQKDVESFIAFIKEQFPTMTSIVESLKKSYVDMEPIDISKMFGKTPTFDGGGDELSKSALNAIKRAMDQAKAVRFQVYPEEALANDLMTIQLLAARFPKILDTTTVRGAMANLWDDFRDKGMSAAVDVAQAISILTPEFQSMFEGARVAAEELRMEMEAIKEKSLDATPDPKMDAGLQIIQQLPLVANATTEFQQSLVDLQYTVDALIDQGDMSRSDGQNILDEFYWDRVSWAAELGVAKIANAMNDPALSPEQAEMLGKALKKALVDDVREAYSTLGKVGVLLQDLGADKAGKVIKGLHGIVGTVSQIGGSIAKLPALFSAMQTGGVSAAAAIGSAMQTTFHIVSNIAQTVSQIISLFADLGEDSEEELKGMAKVINEIAEASEQWIEEFTDAIIDFARTGELTFKEFADSVIEDLFRIAFTELIMTPIVQGIGSILPMFGGGGVFNGGSIQKFGGGGVVQTPTMFPTAKGTGIMGEAGPEGVIPLANTGSGLGVNAIGLGGNGTIVNVYAQGAKDEDVTVEKSTDVNGQEILDIMIRNSWRASFGEGEFNNDLQSMFSGLRRRPI